MSKVMSELAAETSLRKMVKDLNDALEKQGIDMTVFKANQFAALSVYYAKFLTNQLRLDGNDSFQIKLALRNSTRPMQKL